MGFPFNAYNLTRNSQDTCFIPFSIGTRDNFAPRLCRRVGWNALVPIGLKPSSSAGARTFRKTRFENPPDRTTRSALDDRAVA